MVQPWTLPLQLGAIPIMPSVQTHWKLPWDMMKAAFPEKGSVWMSGILKSPMIELIRLFWDKVCLIHTKESLSFTLINKSDIPLQPHPDHSVIKEHFPFSCWVFQAGVTAVRTSLSDFRLLPKCQISARNIYTISLALARK